MSTPHKNIITVTLAGKLAFALAGGVGIIAAPASANDFTAGKVMNEMDFKQRYAFVAGVVEGLAVARYMKDGKKPGGMNCIYDWFYDNSQTKEAIFAAFKQYADYPPGAVIDVLAKQKCGE